LYNHRNKIIATFIVLLAASLMVVSIPPAEAQPTFALATWDWPDAYGQGIDSFVLYSNSTGSWVVVDLWYWDGLYGAPDPVPWNASEAIKLRVRSTMNTTLVGTANPALGQNYIRHSIVVTDQLDAEVFVQQNFTYETEAHDFGIYPGIIFYYYYVIFDFLPISGELYTVEVTYEVYY